MAKPVLKKFIEGRPNDRIGLVVFAAQAFIATPLTLDHEYLLENIDRLGIGTINSDATAIGDGITTALNRLRDLKSKSKIIVLMTDGGNNSGKIDPITATEAAQALGVKIYTIGLGNREIVQQMGLPPRLSAGRGDAAKNRGHDRRQILSRGQRGEVPENLRGN